MPAVPVNGGAAIERPQVETTAAIAAVEPSIAPPRAAPTRTPVSAGTPAPAPASTPASAIVPAEAAAPVHVREPAAAERTDLATRLADAPAPLVDVPPTSEPTPTPGLEPPASDPTSAIPRPAATPTAAPREPVVSAQLPVTLARVEDLATALERMQPIPRGGAMLELETPGLGPLRLHVRMDDGVVHIRIQAASSEGASWLAAEREGLTAAARGAVCGATDVELDLHGGTDDAGERRPGHDREASPYARGASDSTPAGERTRASTSTPARARGLVDVLA